MMGFGSYGGNAHGGGSSNLSALAPPFTVDRSIPITASTPLVDLGEPLNWLDSNPYSFNSPQAAHLPRMDLDPVPTPSYNQNSDLFEPKAYYSPYVSPSLHVPNFNEQSLSGLDHTAQWGGGSWDWEKGKPGQLGGSFYSKDTNVAPSSIYTDHINLGVHPTQSLKLCEETSHNIYSLGRENQVGPPSIEKLDYNPVLGQNHSFMPVDYSKNNQVIGSSSAFPENDLQVPPLNFVNCKNNQVSFCTPYEKPVRQHGTTPNDSIPAKKSSPGIVIRPPAVGACSSVFNTVSFKNISTCTNGTDKNLSGKSLSYVKEPHFLLNSGSQNDPSQLSFLLDGNCYLSGESSAIKTEKLSTSNMASEDASDHLLPAKSGVTFSHFSPDNFCLALDNDEQVIAMENSLESLDHYNPSVDSPCWRGAPGSYNSPFGSSGPVSVQPVKKLEACDGSNGQAFEFIPLNTANVVKPPSGKPREIRMTVENGNVEDGSVSSLKFPSVFISTTREHQPDDAWKAGPYHKQASSACEIKCSDDTSELKKDYVLFNKSVGEVEKASCTIQQGPAEGGLASTNLRTSKSGVADFEMKINDVSSCGSSHMSCHDVKNLSSSPSSEEDVSTKHSKFLGKEPVSNSSTRVLVDTMHNLSELLLYYCSNETCELKEQDLKSLEKVINNLNTCISKNIEQESLFSELHEGISLGRPQVASIDVLSQHVRDEKYSDFVSVKSGTDIKVKNDKMTQAIKNVLIENFHEKEQAHPEVLLYKNLWLEAEAALCSMNYLARFNNMKIEIEKCKLDSEKDLSEDAPDEDKISGPKFSAEVDTNKKLTSVAESEPTPAVSNQNSPIKSSSYHTDDVAARFHVLKQSLNNSNFVHTGDADELSSPKLSSDLDEVDKLATQVKDSSTPSLPSQDSPVPVTVCCTNDVEASIMARFHILKSRGIKDLDCDKVESKLQPEVFDLGFAGNRKQMPTVKHTTEDGISGVNLELFPQHQVAYHSGELLVVKDFHQCVQHDCTIHSPGSSMLGNQLSAGWYDSCSSDWEHVLKEELSGKDS